MADGTQLDPRTASMLEGIQPDTPAPSTEGLDPRTASMLEAAGPERPATSKDLFGHPFQESAAYDANGNLKPIQFRWQGWQKELSDISGATGLTTAINALEAPGQSHAQRLRAAMARQGPLPGQPTPAETWTDMGRGVLANLPNIAGAPAAVLNAMFGPEGGLPSLMSHAGPQALKEDIGPAAQPQTSAGRTVELAGGLIAPEVVPPLVGAAARGLTNQLRYGAQAVRELPDVLRGRETPTPGSSPGAQGAGFGADTASAARVGTQSRIEQLPDAERAEAERIQAQHGSVNPDALERRVDASTLPVPITLTEGQATRDPMQWDNEFNSRKANPEITERFAQQEQGLKDNLPAIRDQAAPGVPTYPTSQGQIFLDTDKGIDEQWRGLITSKYQRLEAEAGNTGTFPIDGPGFARNADAALSGAAKNYAQFLPASVRSMIEGYREGGPVTFGQFESDRTILANEARAAERAGNGNAAHAIGVVRDQLENVPLPPEYAHLKGLADDARSEAAARFEYIRQNPSYRAAVNDPIPMGQDSPLATNYVGTYLLGKGATSADAHVANMSARWADQPQAQTAMAGATIDHLTGQAAIRGGEGTFAPTGYNKALLGLGLKVRDLVTPETAEQLEQLGRVAHYTKVAPGGSLPNRSGTFVGQAGAASNSLLSNIWHLGLKGAEGFLNVKAGGIPVGTAARWLTGTSEGAMEGRAAAAMEQARQAEVARVLRPGAGLEPREATAGPSGPASTPSSSPPSPPPGFTVDSQGNANPTGHATPPPRPNGPGQRPSASPGPTAGPPPPTQAPRGGPAPSAGSTATPSPSVPPEAPRATPEPAGAPSPPSAGPRSRAPSPGIQATTTRIAQALDVPESAVDGRVRALTTQIERAQRLHGEVHTDAEREFHQDMITSMEKERDAVVQRNILAAENPKGGRVPPPPEPSPAPPPSSGPPSPAEAARAMGRGFTDRSEPMSSEDWHNLVMDRMAHGAPESELQDLRRSRDAAVNREAQARFEAREWDSLRQQPPAPSAPPPPTQPPTASAPLTDAEVQNIVGRDAKLPAGMTAREYAERAVGENPELREMVRQRMGAISQMGAHGWSQEDLNRMGAQTDAARKQQYEATKQPGEDYEDWLDRMAMAEEKRIREEAAKAAARTQIKPTDKPSINDILKGLKKP